MRQKHLLPFLLPLVLLVGIFIWKNFSEASHWPSSIDARLYVSEPRYLNQAITLNGVFRGGHYSGNSRVGFWFHSNCPEGPFPQFDPITGREIMRCGGPNGTLFERVPDGYFQSFESSYNVVYTSLGQKTAWVFVHVEGEAFALGKSASVTFNVENPPEEPGGVSVTVPAGPSEVAPGASATYRSTIAWRGGLNQESFYDFQLYRWESNNWVMKAGGRAISLPPDEGPEERSETFSFTYGEGRYRVCVNASSKPPLAYDWKCTEPIVVMSVDIKTKKPTDLFYVDAPASNPLIIPNNTYANLQWQARGPDSMTCTSESIPEDNQWRTGQARAVSGTGDTSTRLGPATYRYLLNCTATEGTTVVRKTDEVVIRVEEDIIPPPPGVLGTDLYIIKAGVASPNRLSNEPNPESTKTGIAPVNDVTFRAFASGGDQSGNYTFNLYCTGSGAVISRTAAWSTLREDWNPERAAFQRFYEFVDACDYPSALTYRPLVMVTNAANTAQDTATVNLSSPGAFDIVLEGRVGSTGAWTQGPLSGPDPLNGIDLRGTLTSSSNLPIVYSFYCRYTGPGGPLPDETTPEILDKQRIKNIPCNYTPVGTYTAYVSARQGVNFDEDTLTINVSPPGPVDVTLYANPGIVTIGQTSTLFWTSQNAQYCDATSSSASLWTGSNPRPAQVSQANAVPTLPLSQDTTFEIKCYSFDGLSYDTDSEQVDVEAAPPGNNPVLLAPALNDACTANPSGVLNWSYSGTTDAWELQVDNNSDFSSPNIDSPQVPGNSRSYSFPGAYQISPLQYGTTYQWRVRIWTDGSPQAGAWTTSTSATDIEPAPHRGPTVNFSYTPPNNLIVGERIQFNENANPAPGVGGDLIHDWDFDSGATPGNSSENNPVVTYSTTGLKIVRLTATDRDNLSCWRERTLSIGASLLPLPIFKEIFPR